MGVSSTPASTDIIGTTRTMNKEIYQTCVLLTDSLEATAVFSIGQKAQVQKALGDHLVAAMIEDEAKSSNYTMLLMWRSS